MIALLRHGETQAGFGFFGSTDTPLTERGWTQMQAAVESEPQWSRIVASPLIRCAAFAQKLADQRQTPITLDKRLQEIHFGAWEGRTLGDVMMTDAFALNRFWSEPIQNTPPDGEHAMRFAERVLSAWSDIVAAHADDNVLVVTHSGVIRIILCHVTQRPFEQFREFEVEHGALHRVRFENGQAQLI